ncbi:hypothetical protein [Prochlorococcus marinus]|uniref:hypothetical protein n=1 Tax=Prochlorococcus marinus TaxID=1219 RepID=UPI0022B55D5E|nr:hypothetical protein [Prochlorococcus marinus]
MREEVLKVLMLINVFVAIYLVDLSMQELIELAKDYGIEVSKASNVKNIGG